MKSKSKSATQMGTKKERDAEELRLLSKFPDLFHDPIMSFIAEVVPSHQNGSGSLTIYFLEQLVEKLLIPIEDLKLREFDCGFDEGFTEGYEEGLIEGGSLEDQEEGFYDAIEPTSFFEEAEDEFDEEGLGDLDEDE